ncbi:MAG: hypothetical protein QM529_01500 [Hydrotalea sp.]|nr:hypothetical protein [Hydrotalea sp.]
MNKLMIALRHATRVTMVLGLLVLVAVLMAACGTYGSPQYPDGKAPFYTAPVYNYIKR